MVSFLQWFTLNNARFLLCLDMKHIQTHVQAYERACVANLSDIYESRLQPRKQMSLWTDFYIARWHLTLSAIDR